MKYIIEIPKEKNKFPYVWVKDSEHSSIEEAQKRAIEIVGVADCYTETGDGLAKGYFGQPNDKEGWDARIVIEK